MDVSDIFYFSARGRGRGSSRHREEVGGRFSIENPRRGGGLLGEGGAARGWEAVCREFGGGLNIFFSGPKSPPSFLMGSRGVKNPWCFGWVSFVFT